MRDGARDALLGYLYQFIGVTSLRALSVHRDSGQGAWARFLARVANGHLIHEQLGQDAIVRAQPGTNGELVAIQFKHSSDTAKDLAPKELIEILHALEMSRREACGQGDAVGHYVLITNRRLGTGARQLLRAGTGSELPKGLLLKKKAGQRLPKKDAKLVEQYDDSPSKAASAWLAILKQLEVFENRASLQGVYDLRDFALRHGVLADEWPAALTQVIGALVTETANGSVGVDEQWLKQQLVGIPDAADLCFSSTRSPNIAAAARARLELQQEPGVPLVRRAVLDQIGQQLLQFPVVFLIGKGGCGKSVLSLIHLLSTNGRQVGLCVPSDAACEQVLAEEFNRLRSKENAYRIQDRTLRPVVDRLRTANPGVPQVLALYIDALDEPPPPELVARLRHVIATCWSDGALGRSGVTLLISYRPLDRKADEAERELIGRWFNAFSVEQAIQRVGFVHIGEFDEGELADAARLLNGWPERRLLDSLQSAPRRNSRRKVRPDGSVPIPDAVRCSLIHPVVWGAYARLPVDIRGQVLAGDPIALDRLAAAFIERFRNKCHRRRPTLSSDHLGAALTSVAQKTAASPPFTYAGTWNSACAGFLNLDETAFLFGEAITYGLISRDSKTDWRWRHQFAADYLARSDGT